MATLHFLTVAEPSGCLPLTATRALADCPLGNESLRTHQERVLGLAAGQSALWDIHPHAWLETSDLVAFLAQPAASVLCDAQGAELLRRRGLTGGTLGATASYVIRFAWDMLRANEQALKTRTHWDNLGTCHASLSVEGRLAVGRGTRILPGVVVEGDVVIGENCKIGPNCYLRGSTSIGASCHVGQAVELKNSILLEQTNVGHLTYLGDSILGAKVNLGAGTISSNLRHDGKPQRTLVDGVMVDTGCRKFGTIIGDGVHTGIQTGIYPGRKIWPGLTTRPGEMVSRDLR